MRTFSLATLTTALVLALASPLPALAGSAAPADLARISSSVVDWAGGKANADSLVAGLSHAAPITLSTTAPDKSVSLAGFTPARALGPRALNAALASAQHSLAKLGITHPTAEQIQAALIGGEIEVAGGSTKIVRGVIAARGTA